MLQSKAVHRNAVAPLQPVSQPAMARLPIGQCTISPPLSRLGEGLAGGLSLAHRALATPCGGPGACKLTFVFSWTVFPSGLSEHCIKKQHSLAGHVSEDVSTFASPEPIAELQQWDKIVTSNWISWNLGEKKLVKLQQQQKARWTPMSLETHIFLYLFYYKT